MLIYIFYCTYIDYKSCIIQFSDTKITDIESSQQEQQILDTLFQQYNKNEYKNKLIIRIQWAEQQLLNIEYNFLQYYQKANKPMEIEITNKQNVLQIVGMEFQTFQSVLQFLHEQQLEKLLAAIKGLSLIRINYETIAKIIENRLTYVKYYAKADRSYYFTIFDNKHYLQLQRKNFANLTIYGNNSLPHQFSYIYQALITQAQKCVDQQIQSQFGQKLSGLFIDPCLPMPKLLRETVATLAQSSIQTYLLEKLQDQYGNQIPYEQVFNQVRQKFEELQQSNLRSMVITSGKIKQLRDCAHLITFQNYRDRLIPNNKMHNLLVIIFGITDLCLQLTVQFLQTVSDPYQLLLQLCSKYMQFQSTIIAIEENAGDIFKNYGELYNEIFNEERSRFSFLEPALAMWVSKMYKFHQKTNKVFSNLVMKIANQNIQNFICTEDYSKLANYLCQNLLSPGNQNSFAYEMIQKQQHEINIVVNTYQEYLIDLSINNKMVAYCGHSKHQLHQIFVQAEADILQQQAKFVNILNQGIEIDPENEAIAKNIVKERIKVYQMMLKPRTLKQILQQTYISPQLCSVALKKIESVDYSIQRYITFIKKTKNFVIQADKGFIKPLFKVPFDLQKSLPETMNDSNDFIDNDIQVYQTDDQDEGQDAQMEDQNSEQLYSQMQIQAIRKLSKTI